MKRTLALFLALLMALSLCACGGGDSTTKTLVSTDWKAVLDYGLNSEHKLSFNKDGTGLLSSPGGHGGDITWSAQDNVIKIEWKTTGYTGKSIVLNYTFDLVEVNGSYRLVEDNEADGSPRYWTFVPEDKYDAETEAIKAERLGEAQELDEPAAQLLSSSNEAKFNAQYVGKLWKWTGEVSEIGESYCLMFDVAWASQRLGGLYAYMSTDDLASINPVDTITIVGILANDSQIFDAFIVQE